MINHGTVKSTEKPEERVIDDYSVWIASGIEEYEETTREETRKGYQYDLIQYTKNEYIRMLPTQADLESTQEAIDFLLLSAE
jgi:UPF0288 family protein (methanogenesis marker protein 3)